MSKKPYKEPMLLFTAGSLRQAAWAGWHSARGDRENAERFCRSARVEWVKEIAAGRRYAFLHPHNLDLYSDINPEVLKDLVDKFLKTLKKELKRASHQFGRGI